MTQIFIDGKEGTTGLRLYDRLKNREDITLLSLPEALRKDPGARQEMLLQADISFLCLPDAAAKESVQLALGGKTKLIDTSTAHRTNPAWAYGFPELSPAHREKICSGANIAVPGCHASGFIALVYPLVQAGILGADHPLFCHSVTGYSGGGKSMIADYESAGRNPSLDSPRQYGITQAHKHLPEMQAVCSLASPPIFTPIVADFYAGMVVTVGLFPAYFQKTCTKKNLHTVLQEHFANQKLIEVVPLGQWEDEGGFIPANELDGLDILQIAVVGSDERPLLAARFDNLGKGASGAAVQCMNILMGTDETKGLKTKS